MINNTKINDIPLHDQIIPEIEKNQKPGGGGNRMVIRKIARDMQGQYIETPEGE